MPAALVTGASGFVGVHLVQALEQQGWQVHKIGRHTDLGQYQLSHQDVVFHLAALAHAGAQGADEAAMMNVNAQQTLDRFEQACSAGAGHFVWLSSIKVLGDSSARALTPEDPYAPGDSYARSKVRGEELLLAAAKDRHTQASAELSIVRPPLVYGPGVSANFLNLWHAAMSPWPLPLGAADAPRAWLGVDNLVSFLLTRVASQTQMPATIWHVCDDEQASVREMVTNLRSLVNRNANLWTLPVGLVKTAAALLGKSGAAGRLFDPLPVDDSQSRQLLSWSPAVTQQQQLEKVHTWYQQR
ncbi:MAG: NAD-dependent epimerase/dehydratase family protein [Pseudomonadaceae bacterium]|nr:NAD-dependent epimerase/dehydratase family protein [Pseudomonadaceae bacterium]